MGRSRSAVIAALVGGLLAAWPSAAASDETPTLYISSGSELHYRVARAPLPARQLGAVALAAADQMLGQTLSQGVDQAAGAPESALPPVLGAVPPDIPPPGWPARSLARSADSHSGRTPLGSSHGASPCDCATAIGDTAVERIAAVYATREFTVGDELDRVRLLQLRVRYRDGLVVHINGQQVARRNLDPAAGPMDIAVRPHGPEWETFFIPVRPGLLARGTNLLAIEVRPSGNRLAPALDVELAAATRARIVRGPMLQQVDQTSAVLVFETDLPTQALVEYGPTPARGQVAHSAGRGLAMRHLVRLSGLAPGQAVHYRVIAGSDTTEALRFHTAPAPGAVLRFVVYGDMRGGHDVHGALVQAMLDQAPDLVLVTGDLVLRGSDEGDWQRFFAVTAPLLARIPYYPAAGNHDTGKSGDERRRMNEIFLSWPGPADRPTWGHWYSFDVAGVHFVMLDSNAYQHAEQLAWLERNLRQARERGARAIFATAHDGPYSRGPHGGNAHAAEHYVPLLSRYGVSLLFTGHDHLYQRGEMDGLAYMVSGGGGAPLYRIRCGVPGKRRCATRDGMAHVASEYHYIAVTVYPGHVEACPRRPDNTPLEPCVTYPLRAAPAP